MDKRRKILKLTVLLMALAVAVSLVYLYFHFGLNTLTIEDIQIKIANTGALAPIVYILVSFLQVTLIPLPGNVVTLAGGILFGAIWGSVYSFIGQMAGALFAFFLGRALGLPFIKRIFGSEGKVSSYIKRLNGKENVLLFFMFLFPLFPDDMLCALAGILLIKWQSFLVMQLISRPISIVGTVLVFSGELIPYNEPWGVSTIAAILFLMLLLFLVALKNYEKFNTYLDNIAKKLTKRKNGGK